MIYAHLPDEPAIGAREDLTAPPAPSEPSRLWADLLAALSLRGPRPGRPPESAPENAGS